MNSLIEFNLVLQQLSMVLTDEDGERIVSAPTPQTKRFCFMFFVWPFLASRDLDELMSKDHAKAIASRRNWIPLWMKLPRQKLLFYNLFESSTYGLVGSLMVNLNKNNIEKVQ